MDTSDTKRLDDLNALVLTIAAKQAVLEEKIDKLAAIVKRWWILRGLCALLAWADRRVR